LLIDDPGLMIDDCRLLIENAIINRQSKGNQQSTIDNPIALLPSCHLATLPLCPSRYKQSIRL